MRAILGAISISSIVLLAALAQDSQTTGALIDGSVANRVSGAPVKRAHVMFALLPAPGVEDSSETHADTDASGRFSARLEPGGYRVWVERPGFSRLNYGASSAQGLGKVLNLTAGQEVHDLSFRLSPLGAISGHVLDEDGDPIQGAGVQVLKFSYATGKRVLAPVSGTSSNDRGEYRAFGLPPGRYFLLVTRPGAPLSIAPQPGLLIPDMQDVYAPIYYPGVLDFSSATQIPLAEGGDAQDMDISFQHARVVTLRGRLLSPFEDFANSQIQLVLAPANGASSHVNLRTAVIDRPSGRFEFHGVTPGSYVLVGSQLYRGRALSARLPIEVTNSGRAEDISLNLAAGSEITGTADIDGASSDALRGARVVLLSRDGLVPGDSPAAQIDAGGEFRLSSVTPGVWDLSVSPMPKGAWLKEATFNGHEIAAGVLELAGPSRGILHITLSANAARVTGTVSRDSQPRRATVVLAPVAAELRAIPGTYVSAMADDQGSFALEGVRPGSYKIFAFEDIGPFEWLDPDFLASVDSLGQDLTLSEGADLKKDLTAIATDPAQPAP